MKLSEVIGVIGLKRKEKRNRLVQLHPAQIDAAREHLDRAITLQPASFLARYELARVAIERISEQECQNKTKAKVISLVLPSP
jgi:hypothetical protein